MNTDVLQGKWMQAKGEVKRFFGKLTDDDLTQIEGNRDKLLGKLQERYGYTREQAENEWNKFTRQYPDLSGEIKETANDMKNAVKSKG
jgi:uncharacterized protein YjbJ (UPF0337 family)